MAIIIAPTIAVKAIANSPAFILFRNGIITEQI